MKRPGVLLLLFLLTLFSLLAGVSGAEGTASDVNETYHADMQGVINVLSEKILSGLSDLQADNQKSADTLTSTGISGEQATAALNTKVERTAYCHSSLIIDPKGNVTAAAPANYAFLIGQDLSEQDAVKKANDLQKPVLSDLFLLKEGFYGISFSQPVFAEDKTYLGYTDITFRPEDFFSHVAGPVMEQTRYDLMILQPDGTIIYETNEEEIGRNGLTDPLYADPQIHQACLDMVAEKTGITTYAFWNTNWNHQVHREAVWDTVEYANQEWRIILIRDLDSSADTQVSEKNPASVVPEDLNASLISLDGFISGAVAFAKENGREAAIREFNNLNGSFVSGDRYIFAYDMDGNTLALPYQPGLIGKNRMNLSDTNGLAVMPGMIDMVKSGGGRMYFVYPNAVNNFTPELKVYNVTQIDDTWFIGSGIFLPSVKAAISVEDREALMKRVKAAGMHANEVGKATAISDFNDINGTYADGGDYIFAYGYDGTTLALPHQDDLIGTMRLNYTDVYGSPIIRQEIDAAKRGGGFVYVVYDNPDTKETELKLCYVEPAGEDWLIGSGIYTGQLRSG